MKYLMAVIIVISLVFIPNSIHAWPEPKEYPVVWLTTQSDGSWVIGTYQGGRWPFYATDKLTNRERDRLIPPQLNPIQAQRWYMASPAARPYLAQIYGVSDNVAIQYGANYIEIRQLWED